MGGGFVWVSIFVCGCGGMTCRPVISLSEFATFGWFGVFGWAFGGWSF